MPRIPKNFYAKLAADIKAGKADALAKGLVNRQEWVTLLSAQDICLSVAQKLKLTQQEIQWVTDSSNVVPVNIEPKT